MAQKVVETMPLWKQRFHAFGVAQVLVASGNPERGAVVSLASGSGQLNAWNLRTGEQQQRTDHPGGVFDCIISPDGNWLIYLRDEQAGGERGHYVRVPWGGGETQDLTPGMASYGAIYRCAVSGDGRRFAFTPFEPGIFPLYCVDLTDGGPVGEPRQIHRSPKLIEDAALSADGEIVVISSTARSEARQYVLLAFDAGTGEAIGELSDLPEGSIRPAAFSPRAGDDRLLATDDRSGSVRPFIWNPRTAERTELALAGLEGDVAPVAWSDDARRILLLQTVRAARRIYVYDLEREIAHCLDGPEGTYDPAGFGPDGEVIAEWTDSTHLPQVLALDSETGEVRSTLIAPEHEPPARPLRSVTFPSSDGQEIQAWLGVPDGEGPFPTVVSIHGGPHVFTPQYYDPEAQAYLDHGYAWLTINYRGSTTFGRRFKEMIWGDLGHWELEDMVAGREWLLREGIARPGAIVVTGASYGGYLTLMALGKTPDLWAAGYALVSEADLVGSYYEGTDWTKGYLRAMMGGTPEEKPEQYRISSPITYAHQVEAPLLAIQFTNDMRCPPKQMENYAARMREFGKPFEIEWFDAGHAGIANDDFVAFTERALAFFDRVLKERNVL
jgi:dipeptidyl aminopeptidase/acylaminoacyl peptidase